MKHVSHLSVAAILALVIGASPVAVLPAVAVEPPQDLLGYWPFDEGAGPLARDLVGGNDLALVGNPVWTRNASGCCLLFNGTDKHLVYGELKSHKGYRGNVDCGTISVWACPLDGGFALKNDKAGGARVVRVQFPHETFVGISSGRWCGVAFDGRLVEVIVGPPVVNDQWTHLAVTWNEVFARFFVNGCEIRQGGPFLRSNVPGAGVTSWTRSYVAIGTPGWGAMFKGYVDDWKLFKRALAPEDIAAEYAREKGKRSIAKRAAEAGVK